ncbi:MAG TPA: TrkH family potassium uptake protein [Spirochaetota bacterium]|nr:TrkH family potassium uptake protein [Spirochaetota bacterium]HPJ36415.1 TrkH family potassium uptake protein [Spirochaetota bacterium]
MKSIKRKLLSRLSPVQQFVASFLLLIITGAFLLKLPGATVNGITYTDALFTSTSSVCVTGLIVLDTGKDFTFPGQAIILMLIQIGGLGIMTFTIGIFSMFGGSFSLKWRFAFGEIYNQVAIIPPAQILRKILLYTFSIEALTAAVLFTQFIKNFGLHDSLWFSVFHSVSSFCNAGFSTFSSSLIPYQDNPLVILAISFNVILGGLGFIVLTELANMKIIKEKSIFRQFSLHSKIVISSTVILIAGGAFLFLLLEWNHNMKDMTLAGKFLNSFFQSITCRTAGFNSMDIATLRHSTLSVMMILMFIGGSPGSMAGGIKTTTFAVISGIVISKFRGHRQVVFFNRSINEDVINKSMTLVILSFIFIYASTITILSFHSFDEKNSFLQVMFEVISAFGTVGLSTGITPRFPDLSKLLLIIVMLVGRVGPFAIITAITVKRKYTDIEIADENIMIG